MIYFLKYNFDFERNILMLFHLEKNIDIREDPIEEKIALETEKQIQEHVELPKKERRKVERDINGRFKKAAAQSLQEKESKQ